MFFRGGRLKHPRVTHGNSYYESCADASNLPESLDAFYTKCSANAPKWSMLRARCTTDYTLGSFRGASAQAQALAKCNSAGSKCSGIYASSSGRPEFGGQTGVKVRNWLFQNGVFGSRTKRYGICTPPTSIEKYELIFPCGKRFCPPNSQVLLQERRPEQDLVL